MAKIVKNHLDLAAYSQHTDLESLDEPPERLEKAKKEKRLSNEKFLVLDHGEPLVSDDPDL